MKLLTMPQGGPIQALHDLDTALELLREVSNCVHPRLIDEINMFLQQYPVEQETEEWAG